MKTFHLSRQLEEVLRIRLQDVLEVAFNACSKRLQDVLEDAFNACSKRLQDVLEEKKLDYGLI